MTLDPRIESIRFTGTRFGDLKMRPESVEAIGNNQDAARRLFDATEMALDVFGRTARLVGFRRHGTTEDA